MTTRTPRRRRQWQDNIIQETTSSGTQDTDALIGGAITETKGLTLVRLIIGINIHPVTPVDSGVDLQSVALGIGMFTAEAIAAGVLPDPNVEDEQPVTGWLWRHQTIIGEWPPAGVRIDADIRSQRKVMYGGTQIVINNDAESGSAFSVVTTGLIRALYLLP